jgi:hypothetical protein
LREAGASVIYYIPSIVALLAIAWALSELRTMKREQAERTKRNEAVMTLTKPVHDYIQQCMDTNEPYTEEGYQSFLASQGIDYQVWIAQIQAEARN